jgi:PAS domain S-box-containing protein
MPHKLPLSCVYWVDIIGSALMLILAIWIFHEAFRFRRRSFMHLYLFLLSCSLGTFALSRAVGHILRDFLLYVGVGGAWDILAPVSGGANTLIFVLIGSLSFYYGIFRNLQEVRDREREGHVKEVQDTRDFLQKVIDSLNTQLVVIDRSYRIVMANERFLEDAKLGKERVLGRPCFEVLHRFCDTIAGSNAEETETHLCSWKKIREDGRPVTITHVHRYPPLNEPRNMEIAASPVFSNDGEVEYVIETLTDITAKVRLEEMQRSQEKLTAIVEMASAVAHELNTPVFTVLGNAQLLKRGMKPQDPGCPEVEAIIRNARNMSQLTRQMTRITEYATKDYVGGERLVDILAASNSAEEEWRQWQTERADREERWLNLEKMAAMGQLTAGVAHELNNAINIVLGYSQLLLREFEESSRTYEDLKKIEKNAKQCQRIVSGLLDYTRSMEHEREYQDVNRHLEEVLNLVEHRMGLDGIRIVRDFGSDLERFLMDTNEMRQVYLNLLNNAADAIGRKGEILVKTDMDREKREIHISFADTGPGIPQDIMHEIFMPFFSTKGVGAGTGLGLNVSRDIVRRHGGTLEADNRQQGGAIFTIRLPMVKEGEKVRKIAVEPGLTPRSQ